MKLIKYAAAAALMFAGTAYAFHSGGVAECEGCHTMHNSFENQAMATNATTGLQQFRAGPYLLKGSDQSSACLNCHNAADTAPTSYHISTAESVLAPGVAPVEMTPGGDFAWLKKTYTFSVRKTQTVAHGERHGHNIVAADYNYVVDSTNTSAPGGNYPSANLYCSSCHDPHGKYRRDAAGNIATSGLPIFNSGSYNSSADPVAGISAVGVFRLLAGVGYQPRSLTGSYAFGNGPPAAVVNSSYNRSEAVSQTPIAYGQGMSEWCANCHAQMYETSYSSAMPATGNHVHPAGNWAHLSTDIATNYNAYVRSGIMTNTGASFSTLAPFEINSANYTDLKAAAATGGAAMPNAVGGTSNVMCLSCHRAHASGFESMTRYFLGNEFMTVGDSTGAAWYDSSTTEGKINFGKTQAEQQAAYYGRPASVFGPYARTYCNKCHAKD